MTTKTWNANTDGDWYANSGANWSPVGVPDDDIVVIDSGDAILQGVDPGIRIASLDLDGGELSLLGATEIQDIVGDADVTDGATLSLDAGPAASAGASKLIVGGGLTNGGSVDIGDAGIASADSLQVLGSKGLVNTGAIAIQGGSAIAALDVADVLTSSGEITVGASGASSASTLNATTIDETGGVIDGVGTISGALDNSGGIVVGGTENGATGTLTLAGNYTQSGSGTFEADISGASASTLAVTGGVDIAGGLMLIAAESALELNTLYTVMSFAPDSLEGRFGVIEFDDALHHLELGNGTGFTLADDFVLEVFYNESAGDIQVEEIGPPATTSYVWTVDSGTWDSGSGADWNAPHHASTPGAVSNVTVGSGAGGTVTFGADQTLNSLTITSGYTVASGRFSLTTNGGVTVASGGTLDLFDANLGTLAIADEALATVSGALTSVGAITVATGGALALDSGTINDSTLSGAGVFSTLYGDAGELADDTIANGALFLSRNAATTELAGDIVDKGEIEVKGGSGLTGALNLADDVTLSGHGALVLFEANGGHAEIAGAGHALTDAGVTIEGAGEIGGSLTLDNQGIIDANSAAGALTLETTSVIENSGVIEATSGGDLVISADISGSGAIDIGAGSEVEIGAASAAGVTFVGGAGAKLRIDDARVDPFSLYAFTGLISGFAAGDILELAGLNAVKATAALVGADTTLSVELADDQILIYTLAGNLSDHLYSVTRVGDGDSDIALVTQPIPTISAPKSVVAEARQTDAISGLSIAQVDDVIGELFTVSVTDQTGVLSSANDEGVINGAGTTNLTIIGTRSQVNADLGGLEYSAQSRGSDVINLSVSNDAGYSANPQSIALTINGRLRLSSPAGATAEIRQATSISGLNVAENGATAGEKFYVLLTDSTGALATTGNRGKVQNSGPQTLVVKGSLAAVNADLALLTVTEPNVGLDTINVSVSDGLGGSASATIQVSAADETVNVATFDSDQASLDSDPGGFNVADSAADLLAALPRLQADFDHIDGILATTGSLAATVAEFRNDGDVLNAALGGFDIADTGATLIGSLSAIAADASHVDAIFLTSGALVVSTADFLDDEPTLNKVSGGFVVSDTAENIESTFAALESDAANIMSIQTTAGTTVVFDSSTLGGYRAVAAKIAGGFDFEDSAADFVSDLPLLESLGSQVESVAFTDANPPTLTLTIGGKRSAATLLAEVASPYILNVVHTSFTATIGHGDDLVIDDAPGDDVITGGGHAETFVFGPNFGTAVITDSAGHWTNGANDDVIRFSASEFANFSTLLADTSFASGVAVIAHGDDRLTLDGFTSRAAMKAGNNLGDFEFM